MHTTFLDVRTKEEFDEGHIPGAVHFELTRIMKGELPDAEKDADVVVYCLSGARAAVAVQLLKMRASQMFQMVAELKN